VCLTPAIHLTRILNFIKALLNSHYRLAPKAASTRPSTHSPASIARPTTLTTIAAQSICQTAQSFQRTTQAFSQPEAIETWTCLCPADLVLVSQTLEQKTLSLASQRAGADIISPKARPALPHSLLDCKTSESTIGNARKLDAIRQSPGLPPPSRLQHHSRRCSCPVAQRVPHVVPRSLLW
jgi:hypothetical protein